MNTKLTKVIGIVAVLALVAVAFVGAVSAGGGSLSLITTDPASDKIYVDSEVTLKAYTTSTASEGNEIMTTWSVTQNPSYVSVSTYYGKEFTFKCYTAGTIKVHAIGDNLDGTKDIEITIKENTVQIGDVKYGTLDEALGAGSTVLTSGTKVVLIGNATLSSAASVPEGVTLDCGTYELTLNGELTNNGTIEVAELANIKTASKIILNSAKSSIVVTNCESDTFSGFNNVIKTAAVNSTFKINRVSSSGKWWIVTEATTSAGKLKEGINTSEAIPISSDGSGSTTVVGMTQDVVFEYYIPAAIQLSSTVVEYPFSIKMLVPRAVSGSTSDSKVSMSISDSKYYTNNNFNVANTVDTTVKSVYYINKINGDTLVPITKNNVILDVDDSKSDSVSATLKFSGKSDGTEGVSAKKAGTYEDYLTFKVETDKKLLLEAPTGMNWYSSNAGMTSLDKAYVAANSVITYTIDGVGSGWATVTIGDLTIYAAGQGTYNPVSKIYLDDVEVDSGETVVTKSGVLSYTLKNS